MRLSSHSVDVALVRGGGQIVTATRNTVKKIMQVYNELTIWKSPEI